MPPASSLLSDRWSPPAAMPHYSGPDDVPTPRSAQPGAAGHPAPPDQGGAPARKSGSDLLASAAAPAAPSETTEFYSPVPPGYIKGRHKYVVVLGTVMSGLGKGIFAASLAKLLKDKGLVIAPIKMEGYLNIDAGTLNPYRHGEVFVLDDGAETDMDLGAYERLLDQNLARRNFVTSGQLYSEILDRERHGGYLGRDVQMIPHVTGEVKRRLRDLALQGDGERPADLVFVEVGGTVGDYENGFYIEALRELAFEEGADSVCFVALTYVIEPPALGEQKSKAAQLGIKRLMEAGVQPHIVACRAHNACSPQVMQKIAMFSNVPLRRVFSLHDRESIYTIPEALRAEAIDREVLSILDLHDRVDLAHEDRSRERWLAYVSRLTAPKTITLTIGLAGKYVAVRDAYASVDKAIEHCSTALGAEIDIRWIETSEVDDENVAAALEGLDAVIVPGGFGSRGVEGKIACVRHCRETGLPFLGICLGFQMAVIEFARNVLGLPTANSSEFDARTADPVISELPEQKKIERLGGTMRLGGQDVLISPATLAAHLYAAAADAADAAKIGPLHTLVGPAGPRPRDSKNTRPLARDERPMLVRERFRHRYEVDPAYITRFEAAGLIFSGRHTHHPIMQVLELPYGPTRPSTLATPGAPSGRPANVEHPYFIAAQYHPELTSRPLRPSPLFMGLVAAALRRRPGAGDIRWPIRPFVPAPSAAHQAAPARDPRAPQVSSAAT